MKEILVCLEGSLATQSATRIAIEIARELPAALVGMAIVDEPDIRAGSATSIGGASFKRERDDALVADAHEHAADWLALFERRCREAGVGARALEVAGRPAGAILAEMRRHDLAVMANGANFRIEIQSHDPETRDRVLHRAERPVLLVPEAATTLGGRALIAFDGSRTARRAVESFAASGLGRGRKLDVVTVDDNGEQAWVIATQAVALLEAAGLAAEARNVVSPLSTVDALLQTAGELGATMLVMGAYARSRFAEMFSSSVTRALVESAQRPLFLQH